MVCFDKWNQKLDGKRKGGFAEEMSMRDGDLLQLE